MPWDGTELWIAEVGADGRLGPPALRGRRRRRVDLPARVVARRHAVLRRRIAPAGGISTACATGRSKPCIRWRRSSAGRNGSSGPRTWAFADESRARRRRTRERAHGIWRRIDVGTGALDADRRRCRARSTTSRPLRTHAVFVGGSAREPGRGRAGHARRPAPRRRFASRRPSTIDPRLSSRCRRRSSFRPRTASRRTRSTTRRAIADFTRARRRAAAADRRHPRRSDGGDACAC